MAETFIETARDRGPMAWHGEKLASIGRLGETLVRQVVYFQIVRRGRLFFFLFFLFLDNRK